MSKILVWDITGECNLRCKHCYNWKLVNNEKSNNEMSLDKCFKFLDKIPLNSHIHILGGEPLMKENFISIVEYLSNKKITYSVVTNGLLLNKSLINYLIQTNITNIIFSLDGPNQITHEKIRGKNTFYELLNNISLFEEFCYVYNKKIKISINITINRFNYTMIKKFYTCLERFSVNEIIFNRTEYEGNAINNNISISDNLWIDTCEDIAFYSKTSKSNTIIFAKPLLLSYLNTKYNTKFPLDILECGILKNKIYMYVKNDGLVYPCNKWYRISEIYIDEGEKSILDMSIDDITSYSTNNSIYKEALSLFNEINVYRDKICDSCKVNKNCFGCILDFHQYRKLVKNIDECILVNKRIESYKSNLLDLKFYDIRPNLEVEIKDDFVVIRDKLLNKKIMLKNDIKDLFIDIYNKNNYEYYKDKCKENNYLYELKRLNIIEERMRS